MHVRTAAAAGDRDRLEYEQRRHEPIVPPATARRRCGDADPTSVLAVDTERVPGLLTDETVDLEPVRRLEREHGALRLRTEVTVGLDVVAPLAQLVLQRDD